MFLQQRVVRKTPVAREVFDDHHLVLRDDVPADGDIARRLPRLGEILGRPSALKKLPRAMSEMMRLGSRKTRARFAGASKTPLRFVSSRCSSTSAARRSLVRGSARASFVREWAGSLASAQARRQRGDDFIGARSRKPDGSVRFQVAPKRTITFVASVKRTSFKRETRMNTVDGCTTEIQMTSTSAFSTARALPATNSPAFSHLTLLPPNWTSMVPAISSRSARAGRRNRAIRRPRLAGGLLAAAE